MANEIPRKFTVKNRDLNPELRAIVSDLRKTRRRRDYSAAATEAMAAASYAPVLLGDLKKLAVCVVPPTITGVLSIRKNDKVIAHSEKIRDKLAGGALPTKDGQKTIGKQLLEQYKYFYVNQRGGLVFTNTPYGRKFQNAELGRKRYPTGARK
ncbi:MAG: hypothetical protein WC792_06060 [Candidatus Micrarchaeia archaeon]